MHITRRTLSARSATAGGIAAATVLALLGSVAPALADPAAPSPHRSPLHKAAGAKVTEAATTASALVAAQAGGSRVEVLDRRTETSTTWANPDGTLTTTLAGGPQRMLRNGKWVGVDSTLARAADGSVRAKAHPGGLRLAGSGGTTARSARAAADAPASSARDLVTLGEGDRRIGVQWKGGLPAPALDGHRATYQDAVPGADLIVDATRTGFEQYLRLKKRPADTAAPMTLPLRVPGLKAAQQADGSVEFTDRRTGRQVAHMPAPMMWDAAVDRRSGEHTHTARVPMKVTQSGDTVELRLTPDPAFLADPATRYPVTIDPSTDTLSVLFDTFVQVGTDADQSASTDLKIGWPGDYAGGDKRVARSFLTWDTAQFADAQVGEAKLALYNYHSWSCDARGWEVWDADPASTTTRWNNQPALKRKAATSTETRADACNTGGWVNADVTDLAKSWASAKAGTGSVALKAADENDTYGWKRFYSSKSTEDRIPQLTVTYSPPLKSGANLQAGAPFYTEDGVYKVNSLTPTLRFTVEDSPEDAKIRGTYEITDKATGELVTKLDSSEAVDPGATATAVVPDGKLVNGHSYEVRSGTYEGSRWSGWSAPITFTVDTGWQPDATVRTLGTVNARLEASDITAATTSDGSFAAIAETPTGTVTVPWETSGEIRSKPEDIPAVGIGITGNDARGVNVGGNVVRTTDSAAVDTVTQPTLEGGSRTLQVIKNADAPHEFRATPDLPAGSTLRRQDDGTIVIVGANPDEPVAPLNAPWAKDANGNPVPTSYRLDGNALVQTVDFDANTAFPVVADPWWNPFSWNWHRIGRVVKNAAKKCGLGALSAYVPVQAHHVSVNIKRVRAGARMVRFGGGPWGFVTVAAAGCLVNQLN